MEYKELLTKFRERRQQIREDYNRKDEAGKRLYNQRQLAQKYNISQARIWIILNEPKKPASKR
ncbi:MAG: hypothetical protein KGJ89_05295 [Patescibacteria group bacterium]|nr:hypothetical protein [Patescibacteria group bacterium]MDE2015849.1 hypothetical protein [Patescibacteria group bacterium]MDE2227338.1 hypothetical protein [Patescibacteria group bacterium]